MDYQEEYNQMLKEGVKNQQKFRYVTIAVVAFVLGFGAAWISFKGQDVKIAQEEVDENRVEAVADVPVGDNDEIIVGDISNVPVSGSVSLGVDNQAPGKSIFVKEILAPSAVWVVVVENNNGVRGNILGAGLFDTEDNAGLVKLLRGTVEGGSYYAVLYREDSTLTEGRSFDLENDTVLIDSAGGVVEVAFTTSSSPE
jgi:hypothetical protein